MMQISLKEKSNKFWRVFALGLLTIFIMVFLLDLTYGMHVFLFSTLLISLIYKDGEKLLFDWLPFIFLFYIYEISRANAYRIGRELGVGTNLITSEIINIEKKIFFFLDEIPNIEIQKFLNSDIQNPQIYDYILFFFYGVIFFAFWGVTGALIWRYKNQYFKNFMWGLLAFSFVSILIFLLIPTAPPWYASEIGLIPPVQRLLWEFHYIPGEQIGSVNDIGGNLFAAVPSLHTGWPVYVSLWIVSLWKKRGYIFLTFPIIIAFATWYGAEHYIFDSIIGAAMAIFFFIISINWDKIDNKLKKYR